MKVYVPVMSCGPYGRCVGAVKKPCFSSYLRRVPRMPAPHLYAPSLGELFAHLTGHLKCVDGCVAVDCLDDNTLEVPQPADIQVEDTDTQVEEDDATPAPSPAESVNRSFLPFQITSPKIGNANPQERLPFSLPFAR